MLIVAASWLAALLLLVALCRAAAAGDAAMVRDLRGVRTLTQLFRRRLIPRARGCAGEPTAAPRRQRAF